MYGSSIIAISIFFITHYKTRSNSVFKLTPEYGYKSACDYYCLDCFLRVDLLSNFLLYFRVSMLLGVERNLQQTYLHKGQTLDRARLFRLFSQKIIWLRPVQDLFSVTQHLMSDMFPVSRICTAYYYTAMKVFMPNNEHLDRKCLYPF